MPQEYQQHRARPSEGLTQALSVSAVGILLLILHTFVLGQIVDLFVYYGTAFEVQNAALQVSMENIQLFGRWFYNIIFILGVCFCAYPIIYVIKRHRYMTGDIQDEQIQQW